MIYQKTLVSLTADKLDTQYGDRKKREREDGEKHNQQALIVARALISAGGTFEFTNELKNFGYATIFQAMAGELHEQGATPMVKAKNAIDYDNVYRNGVSALNAKLIEEWDNILIYSVPRQATDKSIQVITLDGDFVVNAMGQTAAQVNAEREEKRTVGQMKATVTKLSRSLGQQEAIGKIEKIVSEITNVPQPPKGKRADEVTSEVELLQIIA